MSAGAHGVGSAGVAEQTASACLDPLPTGAREAADLRRAPRALERLLEMLARTAPLR